MEKCRKFIKYNVNINYSSAWEVTMQVFVARQPIFDKKLEVCAYELLYRLDKKNYYPGPDGDMATYSVIANTFLLMGIESLTGGKRAFINFTENLLKNMVPSMLPPHLVAIEILEDVARSDEIIAACRKLKEQGYTLVLDDFVCSGTHEPLMELADIIKVDFLNTTPEERRKLSINYKSPNVKFLAEKVETRELYEEGLELGYSYFQGYFFAEPIIISSTDVPVYKVNYLQILQELNTLELDYGRLDAIIKRDVSLSYKLLKYINSAAFGFRSNIKSIKHALVMLGVDDLKKWISLVAMRNLAEDRPHELMTSSVVRARFGELLAPEVGFADKSSDFFLMGLFSMLDALMGRPMSDVLKDLPIAPNIKDALAGNPGLYRDVLELIEAYERAEWFRFSEYAAKFQLKENEVPELYLKSLEWADQLTSI